VKSASDCLELASDEVVLAAARLERLPESAAASRIVGRAGTPVTSDERAFPGGSLQAGDRARTGDIQLGRLALYQLSYTRVRLA
jgi:hypothetical protein